MGVFNKINEKSGVIVSVIVVALALFILGGDFFGRRSLFSRGDRYVGEIAGHNITNEEYAGVLDQVKMNYGGMNDNNSAMINNQAWSYFIQKYAYPKQFEKLGLTVTEEELEELTTGKNLFEGFMDMPQFQDSATHKFNRKLYDDWRKGMSRDAKFQEQFETYKQEVIVPNRLMTKYLSLFQNAVYVTKEEAQREYESQNTKAEVKYLYVPYYSVPDSAVTVSEDEVARYIDAHEKEFKKPLRASLEFVSFKIQPAPGDSLKLSEEMSQLKTEFEQTTQDSVFAANNSDNPMMPATMGLGNLPEPLKNNVENLEKGKVYGPYKQGTKLDLYKVVDMVSDPKDTMYYASTKHILFLTREKSAQEKDSIRKKAEEVLAQLKKGEVSFEDMVQKYSDDPGSKATGGEYKWFPKGQMVKPFEKAVFDATAPGLVPRLVETEYGYHILKVTNVKSNKKFVVATIEKEMMATEGREKAYQDAYNFAMAVKDTASFRAKAKKDSVNIQKVPSLTTESVYVGSLVNPKELMRWALVEGDPGDISKVYQIGDQFVVAALITQREKGVAAADEVMAEVKPKIMNEKKAEIIKEKLQKIQGNIEKKGEGYGPTASVGTAHDVTLASGSMQGIGYDPALVGTVFGLVEGKRTLPLKGDNGVAILELVKLNKAAPVADYSSYKNNLASTTKQYIATEIDNAVKENADIEDNRIKFLY